ncbi:MAG TPA: protein kinase [Bacteroidota bacterium]|nr:protein kinase [Bacteroidota bacterium]
MAPISLSRYKIFEELGRGGMGIVYRAEDLKLHRIVALKFFPEDVTVSEPAVERFQREAEAISAMNHPNIATLYDCDETDGRMFLALEFLPGGTLKSKVKRHRSKETQFTVKEVLDYGIQLAEGLAHAHKRQIVHRDVKTDNVMLTEEGRVKITDFGLAKLIGARQLTRSESTVGTAAYMSPEQIRAEVVDHRSDIFSLGVVLYELLTTHMPFRAEHEAALAYTIIHEDPSPVESYRTDAPEPLVRIIKQCLEKERERRYQNADEVAADLRRLREGSTVSFRRVVQHSTLPWVAAAAVLIAAGAYLLISPWRTGGAQGKTIAVLPFSNMSGNPEDEYFSDGMTEDILTHLGKIGSLRVISRTTMMQFKGTRKSVREIGSELHAEFVLEGSVRRSADQVRITAQLIDAKNDEHIWAETYDKELKQIFVIQSDVAQAIATALQATLSPSEKERIEKKFTNNLEAYDLYLKGRYNWNKRMPDKLKMGIDLFHQAIAMDSSYALAYAGLADSYTILGNFNLFSPGQMYPEAKVAALRALALDNNLAEAHASLAFATMNYDWDWPAAESELKRAIEIDPNYSTARSWYALLLTVTGRFEEAALVRKKALELDPLSPVINADIGLTLYFARRYDEAIEQFLRTLEIDPTFVLTNILLAGAYEQKKMYAEAIANLQTVTMGLSFAAIHHPIPILVLGHVFAVSGRKDDALNMLEIADQMSASQYVAPYWMGVLSIGLGEKDQALTWLEKAFKEHDGSMVFLKVDPVFDPIRSDPKFIDLLHRMKLDH